MKCRSKKTGGPIIAKFTYSYDDTYWEKNGTRTRVIENILKPGTRINAQVDYEYDNLYRLTREHRTAYNGGDAGVTYDYEYAYDAAGNRVYKKNNGSVVASYTYDAANKITNTGYAYDIKGNMTEDRTSGATYTWDLLNRLTEWEKTGETTQDYVYNAYGVRVRKTMGQAVTNFLLDRRNIVEEISGLTVTAYVGPDQKISDTTRTICYTDGHSIRAMSDENSAVIEAGIYDKDGSLKAEYPSSSAPNFGYLGQSRLYTDSTGLQYLGFGYYDPSNSRFISRGMGCAGSGVETPPDIKYPPSWWPYPEPELPVKPTPSIRIPGLIGTIGFLVFGCATRLGDGTLPPTRREQMLKNCEDDASKENSLRLKKCWGDYMNNLFKQDSLEKYLKCKDAANKDYYDELTECDEKYGNY